MCVCTNNIIGENEEEIIIKCEGSEEKAEI